MRTQIGRQRKEIQALQRAGISTLPAKALLARMQTTADNLCADRDPDGRRAKAKIRRIGQGDHGTVDPASITGLTTCNCDDRLG